MVLNDSDPVAWSVHTRAPPHETPQERAYRLEQELNAKKRSDAIDDELRRERERTKKEAKGVVKVLLLGQSESGKSTTLKNFRMAYARSEWDAELKAWRAVIQLNLLKSVITILDALQAEQDGEGDYDRPETPSYDSGISYSANLGSIAPSSTSSVPPSPYAVQDPLATAGSSSLGRSTSRSRAGSAAQQQTYRSLGPSSGSAFQQASTSPNGTVTPTQRSRNNSSTVPPPLPLLSGKHQLLKLRLAPLRSVEVDLRRRLGAGAEEDYGSGRDMGVLGDVTNARGGGMVKRKATQEFTVRRLKDALDHSNSGSSVLGHGAHGKRREDVENGAGVDDATEVIARCADDIRELWGDEVVKGILRKRMIRLEDGGGFFLDDVDRIASRTYIPSSNDVVRARLRTLGVQEYRIKFEQGSTDTNGRSSTDGKGNRLMRSMTNHILNFGNEWILYDVGGSRTGRHAWIPYFEGVNAIIFLAPVSCFDERLLEDASVNRLEDSFLLWRTVCSSPLLKNASLILFMNKCDLLRRKIKKGIQIKDYLPSYGDRANDMGTVVRYLKDKFKDICRSNSEPGRSAYYYATSVTDTKTTAMTLVAVKDIILREHLKNADFV